MHLLIDGYNLLHAGGSLVQLNAIELQWKRDRLIDQLSAYKKLKRCEITVVFDGWQGGWSTEKKEMRKGVEIVFSKIGEKADEVIKRLARERGSGVTVITSDREISKYAQRMAVAVIPSDQFSEKMEKTSVKTEEDLKDGEDEGRGLKRKGPSRRLSKKEKRKLQALRKL